MQLIDPSIFKAYDIRGVYPSQINSEVVYKIAQAFVKLLLQTPPHEEGRGEVIENDRLASKSTMTPTNSPSRGGEGLRIVAGTDMRLCGEEFKKALIRAFVDAGVNVIDIGLVSTDQFYFAVHHLNADGGIIATASHNPKEYGGLKIVREKGMPISGDSGIYTIRDQVMSEKRKPVSLSAGRGGAKSEKPGTIKKVDITEDYFNHVLSKFDISKIKPLKIVANANFGMANSAIKKLKDVLPIKFIKVLNNRLDGSFPKGRPDPLVPENRGEIIETVKKLKPDLGVAWDADADRCFFFDEKGEFVTPAYINALLAEYYLKKYPHAKILHDTRVVRVIDDVVEKNGGISIATKAGHSFIKERMIKEQAVFGCETSGHYYFKENFYLDNGLMPFLAILDILSNQFPSPMLGEGQGEVRKTFSEILKPLRGKFYISEEINFEVANQNILEDIRQKYQDAQIGDIDGYDFNYPNWRFNVRKSNTENLLRLNVEADNSELLKQKIDEISDLINQLK